MKIHNEPRLFHEKMIEVIEKKYNAKYVFESTLKSSSGNWLDQAFAIFYTEEPHPHGSNYFGIGYDYGTRLIKSPPIVITNGISATEDFEGILFNGEVFYSRYCHDFRQYSNGLFVDGGRDYTRYGGSVLSECKRVKIRVNKDKLEVVNEEVSAPIPFDVSNSLISGYLV